MNPMLSSPTSSRMSDVHRHPPDAFENFASAGSFYVASNSWTTLGQSRDGQS